MPDPFTTAALLALLLTAITPPPTRPLRWSAAACAILFAVGSGLLVGGMLAPLAGGWEAVMPGIAGGLAAIALSMWLAHAPNPQDADGEEEDDGRGNMPRVPPTPPLDPGGIGLDLDWSAFDRERARWERPTVGV